MRSAAAARGAQRTVRVEAFSAQRPSKNKNLMIRQYSDSHLKDSDDIDELNNTGLTVKKGRASIKDDSPTGYDMLLKMN